MVAGYEGDADAEEDSYAASYLPTTEGRAEPNPFNQRTEGGGEALDEQEGKTRAQAGQGLEQGDVPDADAQNPADEKHWKGVAAQADSETVGPEGKEQRGAGEPPKICFGPANQLGRAMAADD